MHTPGTESEQSLGAAARQVAEHGSALVRLELELATLELRRKVAPLAIGIGLGLVAALVVLYALGFALAGGAAALATVLSTWAALLVVAGGLLVLAVLLGLFAAVALKRGGPPVPEQAIEEAKITQETLTGDGSRL